MHCFYVLIHGTLRWQKKPAINIVKSDQPAGFFCHRFVLARDAEEAEKEAFRRVIANLDRQSRWLSNGEASLELEAEKVSVAPIFKLLKPENKGHTFY